MKLMKKNDLKFHCEIIHQWQTSLHKIILGSPRIRMRQQFIKPPQSLQTFTAVTHIIGLRKNLFNSFPLKPLIVNIPKHEWQKLAGMIFQKQAKIIFLLLILLLVMINTREIEIIGDSALCLDRMLQQQLFTILCRSSKAGT